MKYSIDKVKDELRPEIKEGRITLAQAKWLVGRMEEINNSK